MERRHRAPGVHGAVAAIAHPAASPHAALPLLTGGVRGREVHGVAPPVVVQRLPVESQVQLPVGLPLPGHRGDADLVDGTVHGAVDAGEVVAVCW